MRAESYLSQADQMDLHRAILLYESNTQTIATLHDMLHTDNAPPQILPGQCLTAEMLDELLRKLSASPVQRSILPPEVLCDTGCLCWWKPSCRAPIFFNTKSAAFNKELNGKEVLHPTLLFLAKPGRLQILALSEDKRPGPDTPLFRAPYYNLYSLGDEGAMCQGNVRLPEVTLPRDIPIWEKAFFETNFTHSNIGGAPLTKMKGGHDALWRVMAKRIIIGSHADYLVPLKITLQEAVNK